MADNINATTASGVVRPDANNYVAGSYFGGNIIERIGDWFTGYDRESTYNSAQSVLDKKWDLDTADYLRKSQYQTAVNDLKAAGLNPWLAIQNGGISASSATSLSSGSNNTVKKKESKTAQKTEDAFKTMLTSAVKLMLMAAIFA